MIHGVPEFLAYIMQFFLHLIYLLVLFEKIEQWSRATEMYLPGHMRVNALNLYLMPYYCCFLFIYFVSSCCFLFVFVFLSSACYIAGFRFLN